jgi:hypothetical protein
VAVLGAVTVGDAVVVEPAADVVVDEELHAPSDTARLAAAPRTRRRVRFMRILLWRL